MALSMQN